MNLLGIDTSTGHLSLAISSNGKVIAEQNEQLGRTMSTHILPKINQIFQAANLSLQEIDGIAVGLGPGSFTSLRIGLATIKGLIFKSQIPVVGISSLDVIAQGVDGIDHPICVLTDAKRSKVFACVYKKIEDELIVQTERQLIPIQELLDQLSDPCYFVGEAVSIYRDEILQSDKSVQTEFKDKVLPSARHLLELAQKNFQAGTTETGETLSPLYIYPEDCQVRG